MLKRQKLRITYIASGLLLLSVAIGLVLTAFQESIVYFHTPVEVSEKQIKPGQRFRLGGLVSEGSIKKIENATVTFDVTDKEKTLSVTYKGILPDLFREGQGIVAEGQLNAAGIFEADTVLAKHDETYMPKEVADSLKKRGVWKEGDKAK